MNKALNNYKASNTWNVVELHYELTCGNFAKIVTIMTLMVPTRSSRNTINRLKNTSSAMTTKISKMTTDIKEAKNNFRTISGFLFEIGTPFISI